MKKANDEQQDKQFWQKEVNIKDTTKKRQDYETQKKHTKEVRSKLAA